MAHKLIRIYGRGRLHFLTFDGKAITGPMLLSHGEFIGVSGVRLLFAINE